MCIRCICRVTAIVGTYGHKDLGPGSGKVGIIDLKKYIDFFLRRIPIKQFFLIFHTYSRLVNLLKPPN